MDMIRSQEWLSNSLRKHVGFKFSSHNTMLTFFTETLFQQLFRRRQEDRSQTLHGLQVNMWYFDCSLTSLMHQIIDSNFSTDVLQMYFIPTDTNVCRKWVDHAICYCISKLNLPRMNTDLGWSASGEKVSNQKVLNTGAEPFPTRFCRTILLKSVHLPNVHSGL